MHGRAFSQNNLTDAMISTITWQRNTGRELRKEQSQQHQQQLRDKDNSGCTLDLTVNINYVGSTTSAVYDVLTSTFARGMAISGARRKLRSRSLVRSLAPSNRIELQLYFHIDGGRLRLGKVPPRAVRLTTTMIRWDRKREVGDADERKSVRFQNREEIWFYVSLLSIRSL